MAKHVKPQIFLVDGEISMSSPVVSSMIKEGYEVTCFDDSNDCLEKLSSARCDLLISDVRMPQLNGLKLLKKAHLIVPGLPVLLIDEHSDIPMAVRSIKMGSVDFLKKPLNLNIFLKKVNEILTDNTKDDRKAFGPLTATQKKILKMILDGKSNNEIATAIGRSVRTVELHKSNIMSQFNVDHVVDLAKKAFPMDLS
jgi:FixJ family two-component response regulator